MADDITFMDPQEFRDLGFLQEANRLFFHPRGLALSVEVEGEKVTGLGPIWDYRGDAEGIYYGPGQLNDVKARRVEVEARSHRPTRTVKLGFEGGIQPV